MIFIRKKCCSCLLGGYAPSLMSFSRGSAESVGSEEPHLPSVQLPAEGHSAGEAPVVLPSGLA